MKILGFWHFFVSRNPWNLRPEPSSLVSTSFTHSGDDEDSGDSGIILLFFFCWNLWNLFTEPSSPKHLHPALRGVRGVRGVLRSRLSRRCSRRSRPHSSNLKESNTTKHTTSHQAASQHTQDAGRGGCFGAFLCFRVGMCAWNGGGVGWCGGC